MFRGTFVVSQSGCKYTTDFYFDKPSTKIILAFFAFFETSVYKVLKMTFLRGVNFSSFNRCQGLEKLTGLE